MPGADGVNPGFLILHGIDNERPPEHWHHWLASRLREHGLAVAYPAPPPHDEMLPDNGASFAVGNADAAAVRAGTSHPTRIVCGAEDPYYCPGGPQSWAALIGAEVDLLNGVGHVTPDDGHGPWPSCECWCLDPSARIAG